MTCQEVEDMKTLIRSTHGFKVLLLLASVALVLATAEGVKACPCATTWSYTDRNWSTPSSDPYLGLLPPPPAEGTNLFYGTWSGWNYRPGESDYSTMVEGSLNGSGTVQLIIKGGTGTIYVDGVAYGANTVVTVDDGFHTFVVWYSYDNPNRTPGDSGFDIFLQGNLVYPDVCNPPNQVPEPSTIILLGAGLVGMAGFARKKLKRR